MGFSSWKHVRHVGTSTLLLLAIGVAGVAPRGAGAAITAIGTNASSHAAGDLTLESFSVPAGADRVLVVVASHPNSLDVVTVTFGGASMTQIVERNDGFAVDSIWVRALGTSASPVV